MAVMSSAEAGKEALAREMPRDCEGVGAGRGFGTRRGVQAGPQGPRGGIRAVAHRRHADLGGDDDGRRRGGRPHGRAPVVEMRFADFALCAIDELVNQAAKARYMFGGQGRVPLVPCASQSACGAPRRPGACQSLEAWYAHIPGLVVVCPYTPTDNYGLLRAAIRCDRCLRRLHGAQGPLGHDRRGQSRCAASSDRQGAARAPGKRRHPGRVVGRISARRQGVPRPAQGWPLRRGHRPAFDLPMGC